MVLSRVSSTGVRLPPPSVPAALEQDGPTALSCSRLRSRFPRRVAEATAKFALDARKLLVRRLADFDPASDGMRGERSLLREPFVMRINDNHEVGGSAGSEFGRAFDES